MLSLEPSKRPNVKEILAHPWFTKPIYPSPSTASNLPSPLNDSTPLPPLSPLSIAEPSTSNFFPPSDPVPASPHGGHASGSEVSSSSFDFHDGERTSASGGTSPTTVESGDLGHDGPTDDARSSKTDPHAPSSSLAVREGSIRSMSSGTAYNPLRRTGSESTIRKSESESSGGGHRASSRVDLSGDVMEEEEEGQLDHDEGRPTHHLLPLASNSRTPSRTKRRSISSNFSDRLTSNNSMTHLPHLLTAAATPFPTTDYVTALKEHRRSQFETPVEQEVLRGLETMGFDTGQLMHSVTHDACDTSGALWWILSGKRAAARRDAVFEEQEAQRAARKQSLEDENARKDAERGRMESVSPMTRQSDSESYPPPLPAIDRQPSPSQLFHRAEPPTGITVVSESDDPFMTSSAQGAPSAGDINVEPPTPTFPPSQSESNLSAYTSTPTASSSLVPTLGFSTSKSFPNLQDPSGSSSLEPAVTGGRSPLSSPGKSRRAESGKARSSSVSMLQSLAAGLVRKKSDEKLPKEDGLSPGVEPVKTRSSSPNKLHKPHPPSSSPSSRPPMSVNLSASSSSSPHINPPYEALSDSASTRRSSHPPFVDRSPDRSSLPTINSVGSVSSASSKTAKPSKTNNSLLTTFRMWFKEDSKSKRSSGKRPAHLATSPHTSASGSAFPTVKSPATAETRGPGRATARHSIDSRRSSGQFASSSRRMPNSTLDRPNMARRSSSQQSVHSRRSSVASLHLPPIDLSLMSSPHTDAFLSGASAGLHRRPSDPGRRSMESRTPTSESGKQVRSHSRPSSVRSFNLGYPTGMERHLSRSPTASSAGSTRRTTQASPLQHYHRRVGSGSSTKVVRQIKTVHSHAPRRSGSVGSSIRLGGSNQGSFTDLTALGRALESLGPSGGGGVSGGETALTSLDEEAIDDDGASDTAHEEPIYHRPSSAASSSYSTTVLVAHRTKSALSSHAPGHSSPSHHHHSHSHSGSHGHNHHHTPSRVLSRTSWTPSDLTPRAKPVLRDVFASNKAIDGGDDADWESDDDDGFEGGLGQGGSKQRMQLGGSAYGGLSAGGGAAASTSTAAGWKGRASAWAAPSQNGWQPQSQHQPKASSPFPDSGAFPSSGTTVSATAKAVNLDESPPMENAPKDVGLDKGKAPAVGSSMGLGVGGTGGRRTALPGTGTGGFRAPGIIEEGDEEDEE